MFQSCLLKLFPTDVVSVPIREVLSIAISSQRAKFSILVLLPSSFPQPSDAEQSFENERNTFVIPRNHLSNEDLADRLESDNDNIPFRWLMKNKTTKGEKYRECQSKSFSVLFSACTCTKTRLKNITLNETLNRTTRANFF